MRGVCKPLKRQFGVLSQISLSPTVCTSQILSQICPFQSETRAGVCPILQSISLILGSMQYPKDMKQEELERFNSVCLSMSYPSSFFKCLPARASFIYDVNDGRGRPTLTLIYAVLTQQLCGIRLNFSKDPFGVLCPAPLRVLCSEGTELVHGSRFLFARKVEYILGLNVRLP